MADYQVIARRWRPQQFADIVGQDHIVRTLSNAIESGRIAHAYLFVGPRGTGKTSTARVFAKALNAEGGPQVHPSDESDISQSIMNGNCLDVIEIDGASNNSVDQIRDLREECQYAPAQCTFKIYIIDEVHMLSASAFNALLKTLEEPPPHVKFIFATTESQKVLPTIISRCQRFEFRPISEDVLVERLTQIAKSEKVSVPDGALYSIARLASGGMRDAQSILDQMISFCGDNITQDDVLDVYGLVGPDRILELGTAMGTADYPKLVALVETFSNEGRDLYRVLLDVETLVREALMEAIQGGGSSDKLGAPLSSESLMRMLDALQQSEVALQKGLSEKVNFEVALLKAVEASQVRALDNLIRELRGLKESPEENGKKKSLIPPRCLEVRPIILRDEESPAMPEDVELAEDDEPPEDIIPDEAGLGDLLPSEPALPPMDREPTKLISLDEAISRLPDSLKKEMEELLRAQFREVRPWNRAD